MIFNILQKSKESKSLIGFNFYGSDSGFYCGYVIDYNEDFLIIQHFTKFGVNDGVLVNELADVKYFETETDYLKGIQLLINVAIDTIKPTFELKNTKLYMENFTNLFESFIGNKDYFLKFEMNDDEIYFGFLEWCDEDTFLIKYMDSDGTLNGKAIFKFEDLKLYWIDDLECRRRKIIYKNKKNFSR